MTLTELLMIHRNFKEPGDLYTNWYSDGLVGTLSLSCPRAGCPAMAITLAVDERMNGLPEEPILVPCTIPCPVCGEPLAPHGFESRR